MTLSDLFSTHSCLFHIFHGNIPIHLITLVQIFHISIFIYLILFNQIKIGTNDMSRDTVFVPKRRSDLGDTNEDIQDLTPLGDLIALIKLFIFGWPIYLLINIASQKYPNEWTSHFNPSSKIFKDSQRGYVYLSNFGVLFFIVLK
jgi:hypothetical protein